MAIIADISRSNGRDLLIFEALEDVDRARIAITFRQFLILTGAFWTIEVLLAEVRTLADGGVDLGLLTALRLFVAVLGGLECFALHCLAQHVRARTFRARSAVVLGGAVLAGLLNHWIGDQVQAITGPPFDSFDAGFRIHQMTFWALVFIAWSAIYLAVTFGLEAAGHEARSRQLDQLRHEAQLRALRFQIDPHFLFNTLNSVSALVLLARNEDAEAMIGRLSSFFRTTLATNPRDDISLSEEIALQQTYLEIERVRFPDLAIEMDVQPLAQRVLIPALLLQPLVENAVKYAVANRLGPARIGIKARVSADEICEITIWDDGPGASSSTGTGTGLRNVRDRLHARYGTAASAVATAASVGFTVKLAFPARFSTRTPAETI